MLSRWKKRFLSLREREVIESPGAVALDDVAGPGLCRPTGGVAVDDGPRCEPQGDGREGHADRHEARSEEVVQMRSGRARRLHPDEAFDDGLPGAPDVRPVGSWWTIIVICDDAPSQGR